MTRRAVNMTKRATRLFGKQYRWVRLDNGHLALIRDPLERWKSLGPFPMGPQT